MNNQWNDSDYKLCYVDGNQAYFTTQALDRQTGDDWNDASYEHNAGTPYYFSDYNAKRGDVEWDVKAISFMSDMKTPADLAVYNSAYSVDSINAGDVAWLRGEPGQPSIQAGVTPSEFKRIIRLNGGMTSEDTVDLTAEVERLRTELAEAIEAHRPYSRRYCEYSELGYSIGSELMRSDELVKAYDDDHQAKEG